MAISFRKVSEDHGWLGNMSAHPIIYKDIKFPTGAVKTEEGWKGRNVLGKLLVITRSLLKVNFSGNTNDQGNKAGTDSTARPPED